MSYTMIGGKDCACIVHLQKHTQISNRRTNGCGVGYVLVVGPSPRQSATGRAARLA